MAGGTLVTQSLKIPYSQGCQRRDSSIHPLMHRPREESRGESLLPQTIPEPNQTKTSSSSRNKTNKGTEKRFFSWRFFFPSCFHILYSTLKTGTQDVKPWKQLDATGF